MVVLKLKVKSEDNLFCPDCYKTEKPTAIEYFFTPKSDIFSMV